MQFLICFIVDGVLRVKQSSPEWFLRLRWIFGLLIVLITLFKFLIHIHEIIPVCPIIIGNTLNVLTIAGTSIWGTSFFAVDDSKK